MQAPLPILYSFRRCPYAMRSRLALDVSAQAFELVEVALRDKPAAMLLASPKGTVPVLIDTNGTVIDESLDIMLWALARNDPEQWMAPELDDFAAMSSLIRHFDEHFKGHLDRYKYPNRFVGADRELSRSEAVMSLQLLESRLQSSSYLFGNRAALADMAIVPFVRQFSAVDPGWFANLPLPSTARWLAMILNSPRYVRIMRPAG